MNNSGNIIPCLLPSENKICDTYSLDDSFDYTDKIAQLDGNDTIGSFDDEIDNSNHDSANMEVSDPALACAESVFDDAVSKPSSCTHTVSRKTASFALNKEKQIHNLGVDSHLPDFEITMNDSDRNVNIQCSSAYYDAVAKPVLCGLTKETSLNFNNIAINCSHINYNRDRNGYEYNRVLHIVLTGGGQASIGKVTVHLHHTTRLLQLQGSSVMPDGNTAPVWFLNTFVKERFTRISKDKHYDIKALNEAIRKVVAKEINNEETSNICSLCTRLFTTKAKPTKCTTCTQYFHRTNCLPVHTASCRTTSTGAVSPSQIPSNISVPPSYPLDLPTSSNTRPPLDKHPSKRQRSETEIIAIVTTSASSSNPSPPSSHSSQTGSTFTALCPSTQVQSSTTVTSALNANAAPFTFSAMASKQAAKKPKSGAKAVPMSQESARINYLNLELNSTKTRIVQLETDVNDRDISIKLQREKIKIIEENQVKT